MPAIEGIGQVHGRMQGLQRKATPEQYPGHFPLPVAPQKLVFVPPEKHHFTSEEGESAEIPILRPPCLGTRPQGDPNTVLGLCFVQHPRGRAVSPSQQERARSGMQESASGLRFH